MKIFKFLFFVLFFNTPGVFALTTETFEGYDVNALKAGISKYILTRGGTIDHGGAYENNTIVALEQAASGRSRYTYKYVFNLVPYDNSVKLSMNVYKIQAGKTYNLDSAAEEKIIDAIANSIKNRFLYGLGFDFEYYDSPNGKIRAPKGHQTGIVLTAVKYDAHKKGLLAGDIITEINDVPVNEIPLEEFSTILRASDITDSVTLTYKRKDTINKVTLTPRLNTARTF